MTVTTTGPGSAVAADPEVAVVLLTGAGRAFSAGTDLGDLQAMATATDPVNPLRDELALDKVHIVPAGQPYHRAQAPQASAEQRLAMARLTLGDEGGLWVDAREVRRPRPAYTVETLTELRAEYGEAAELWLLIGGDSLAALPGWLAHHWLAMPLAEWLQEHERAPGGWALQWSARTGTPTARLLRVDRDHGAHKTLAYLKLNPNGLIPVLVDGDLVLYEAAAICLHASGAAR